MGKVVDGVELLRMIRDREMRNNQEILDTTTKNIFHYNEDLQTFFGEDGEDMLDNYYMYEFAESKFKILSEEDKETDIDSIEELSKRIKFNYDVEKYTDNEINNNFYQITEIINECIEKQNELIKAVKQLDKRTQPKITAVEDDLLHNHMHRLD